MLEGSKQKRIADYAIKTLHSGYEAEAACINLNEASEDFMEAYKKQDEVGMVWAYCDYVFWLRVEQTKLMLTNFGADVLAYRSALELINGSTNKGFMMLEFLAKVVPVGDEDIDAAMSYVISGYELGISDDEVQENIRELIYGKAEAPNHRCRQPALRSR